MELRFPSPADLVALADLAAEGIHDPELMPFYVPWTDVEPAERARSVLQWHWRSWGSWTPESWNLDLAVVEDGVVVGQQGFSTENFPVLREGETGSWLGRRYQGRGIGTEMRSAMVHLVFAGLGAESVTSGAFEDNPASLAVSRKIGYVEDGITRRVRRDQPAVLRRLRLSRAAWEPRRRSDIEIVGLGECLSLFGIAAPD